MARRGGIDLPARQLSRLYGVNHFVTSQTNPVALWSLRDTGAEDSLAAVEAMASELWPDAALGVCSVPDARKGERLVLEQAPPDNDDFRSIKGGAWGSTIGHSRAAARFASRPGLQRRFVGFRLVRSLHHP